MSVTEMHKQKKICLRVVLALVGAAVICLTLFLVLLRDKEREWGDSCVSFEFPRISAAQQQEGTLRVMSFNVYLGDLNGVPVRKRFKPAARQIREILPDSFGVQEATGGWMKHLRRLLPEYAHVGVDRDTGKPNGDGEYTAVFYLKERYDLLDSGNFWLSETPEVPSRHSDTDYFRVCTWAKLQNKQTGQIYIHINTHFDHISEKARVYSGKLINDFIRERCGDIPVVFTADLNTTADGEAYAKMTEKLKDTRLCAEDCEDYGTFHNLKPEENADYYIDFVLCSDDLRVTRYRTVTKGIDDRFVSDHFPVYADIVLP